MSDDVADIAEEHRAPNSEEEYDGGALSLGAVVGGVTPLPRSWSMAYRALAARVALAREGVVTPLSVNVVFHVPGEVLKPEFVGVRSGRYSAKLRVLMVQVAIPDMPVPEEVEEYLLVRIEEAIEEAETFARRKKLITEQLTSLREIVERLRRGE